MMKGAVLGLFLFGLFAFLMHGLQTTSASNGGFLTSTTVVLVPIFPCGDQEENAGSPECFEYSADDDRHLSADSAAVTGVPQR